MPILQSVKPVSIEDPTYYPVGRPCIESIEKIVFKFTIQINRSYLEQRSLRIKEDEWLRSNIHYMLELEDPSGKILTLDEIFAEDFLDLPKGLQHGDRVSFCLTTYFKLLQDRRFNLYVNMGGIPPAAPTQRIKLVNPIITKLDKSDVNFPNTSPSEYIFNSFLEAVRLDFEILCDYYEEVPVYNQTIIKKTIKEVIKERLKKNVSRAFLVPRQEVLSIQATIAELKARDTLRDMISEKQFRKYLINGFIMVQGNSGKWYQIFNKQKHLRVYNKGKFIKELCIHTDKGCPPTDHILNLKIMVECDEQAVWKNSNQYSPSKIKKVTKEQEENIIDLFTNLKKDPRVIKDHLAQREREFGDVFFRQYG